MFKYVLIFCLLFLSCGKKEDTPPPKYSVSKIAFSSNRDGKYNIYTMDADGGNQQSIISGGNNRYPNISPEGTGIIYSSDKESFGGYFEIYTSYIDGTNKKKIFSTSTLKKDAIYPVYSKLGVKIAFTLKEGGNSDIYLANNDGTNYFKFSRGRQADFSLYDTALIFVDEEGGNSNIYHQIIGSQIKTNLSASAQKNEYPNFSPDGKYIFYSSNKDGNYEIYRMKPDGSEQVRLTYNSASDISPNFCPSEGKVVFSSGQPGQLEIYTMDVNGKNLKQLTNNAKDDIEPSWWCK